MSPAGTVPSLYITRAVADLRKEFASYASLYGQQEVARAELASQFTKTFQKWKQATGGTFIAFVRELDPKCPAEKEQYLYHRSYQAALYLRRTIERPQTLGRENRRTLTPYQLLARVVRTLLVLVKPTDLDACRVAVAKASQWRGRELEKFWDRVDEASVISLPHLPRLVKRVSHGAVVAHAADRG